MIEKIFLNDNNCWTIVFNIDGARIYAEVSTQEEAKLIIQHFNK